MLGLVDSTESKLAIVKAALNDISLLKTRIQESSLFEKLLRKIGAEVSQYLRFGGRNPRKLFGLFSEFRTTWELQTMYHYDTDGNAFVANLLDLLYTPSWRLASVLVHEAKHLLLLNDKGMLNAPERKQEEFARQFRRESEIKALKAELQFLHSIREHVLTEDRIFVTTKTYKIYKIDESMRHREDWIDRISLSKDPQASEYYDEGKRRAENEHRKIAKILNIRLPEADASGKYKTICIDSIRNRH